MICIKKQYFNWNRVLLLPMGLWPDEETKFTRFRAQLFYYLLMSNIAFQLSRILFAEYSFDLVIKILSSSSFFFSLAIFFMCFWINMKTMKYLLHQLQHIYDRLKDKKEIAIYEKYGYIGKCISARVTIFTICGLFFNFIIIYSPFILDVVIPKNESYAIFMMEIVTKYFVVSEKYYFLIIVHMNATFSVGLIVLTGTGTMMISYFKYACGMFEITRYNVSWYLAPVDIQKMILFLLQRGSRTFTLNVGGLFTASFECFATMTSASVSYFTFMYSIQQ
ncbi:hypothetical protein X777_15045 [Ooceraea biroi]|uniref:Odorant receptor n=1 Tax=Ooceraea biroi TaxID=2015173 RepID=A0A026VYL3_OOCBI|nr:hypothetical protein X777_15045 [Ooceraea biroi]